MAKKLPPSIFSLMDTARALAPNTEIERKFALTPELFQQHVANREDLRVVNILQGWFKHDDGTQTNTYRIRRISTSGEDKYVLDFKQKIIGQDYSKLEYEVEITEAEFNKCSKYCKWFITKDRYYFFDENMGEVEVDVYLGREEIILEKEFPDMEESRRFQVAQWCGEEVTDTFSSKWAAQELHHEINNGIENRRWQQNNEEGVMGTLH